MSPCIGFPIERPTELTIHQETLSEGTTPRTGTKERLMRFIAPKKYEWEDESEFVRRYEQAYDAYEDACEEREEYKRLMKRTYDN